MRAIETRARKHIVVDGVPYINFSGCFYLDFDINDEMNLAACKAVTEFGFANDLGYNTVGKPVIQFEEEAAKFFGAEAALLLTSAYVGSLAVIQTLSKMATHIFIDDHGHYSLFHGALLSGIPTSTFRHADSNDLEQVVAAVGTKCRPLVLTDGVFPTWGDLPPLHQYVTICERMSGFVFVDDAHGTGALGNKGRGVVEHLGVESDTIYFAASLGKAIGLQGGVIMGGKSFIDRVRTESPIYNSVSLPAIPVVAAARVALEHAKEPSLRVALWRNALLLKRRLNDLQITTNSSVVPIVSFSLGSLPANQALHEYLADQGFFTALSNYVASPAERAIRLAVYATHTPDEILALCSHVASFLASRRA